MQELQAISMQGLTAYAFPLPAVEIVTGQRAADMRHVYADLVRAACFQTQADKGETVPALYGFVMGAGPLALLCDLAQDDAGQGPGNGSSDASCLGGRGALTDGQIIPLKFLGALPVRQQVLYLGELRYQYEAGSIFIQAMHWMIGMLFTVSQEVGQHRIAQGTLGDLGGRVDKLSGGLVRNQ